MKFIKSTDITEDIVFSGNYMEKIDIQKDSTVKFIQKIGKQGRDEALICILKLLNSNLESIDTENYTYKHLGKNLKFSELSRGEKVFLVSYAAKITGEPLYLKHDIKQLTKTSLRKYYEQFKDCKNIYIIYDTDNELLSLEYMMQGKMK